MKKFSTVLFLFLSVFNLLADINFAKKLFDDGLIEESREEFKTVINNSPASNDAATANYYIAKGYIKENNYKQAITYLKRILNGYKNYPETDLVLLETGKTYLKLNEYEKSITVFNNLFKNYPTSKYMKLALKPFANALYNSKDYNNAIIVLDKLIKNYSKDKNIPYLYLILAKSYFRAEIKEKSIEIAKKIIADYPNSNERWEAELFLLKIKNTTDYISKLNSLLKKHPPRNYDEKISYLLAKKYYEKNNPIKTAEKLNYIITKYGNSPNLCNYLKFLLNVNLKLNNAEENLILYQKNKKKLPESSCKENCILLYAKSLLKAKKYKDAQLILSEILKNTKNDTLLFKGYLLKSDILKNTKHFIPAIKNYLLCSDKFSKFGKNNFIYYQIGMIYKQNLKNFRKAIKYLSKVSPYSELYNKALFEIAMCYENTAEYKKAVLTLQEINLNSIKDKKEKEIIRNKIFYLKNYKLQDYKTAFDKLLDATIKYNIEKNSDEYLASLVSIYANDLKMYKKALTSISGNHYYLKCKILLKLLEKSKYEGREIEKYKSMLSDNLKHLKDNPIRYKEIELKKKIVLSESENIIDEIKRFIELYPKAQTTEYFKLYVANFYYNQNKMDLASDYIISLNPKNRDYEYYKLKIALAEKFYNENNDSLAFKLYGDALEKINLSNPIIMFHYLVTLYRNNKEQAIDKLMFLVDNTEFFEGKNKIYVFLAKALAKEKKYTQAIDYLLKIPEKYKDDEFYNLLALYYNQTGDFENAKISFMHIKNKNEEILKKLADLQIKTNDKPMAIYTLSQLLSKEKNKKEIYKKLGTLYYETKDYNKAVKYLFKYEIKSGEKDKDAIIKLVVSYLKIKNRPKADLIRKKYKKLFDLQDRYTLTLNYGIYYLDIDPKISIKKFKSIIKNRKLDNEIKYRAYFWRGVAFLRQKKIEEALKDFIQAKQTSDKELLLNVHLKLGTLYFSNEDYEKALKNYMFVINEGGNKKLAYDAAKNFAMVCNTVKDFGKAIETYKIILQRWNNDNKIKAETIFDIGFSYYRDKKYDKAIDYFIKSIDLNESEDIKAEAQYWIGECYFGKENYTQAVTEFLKVYYNYPNKTRWAASAQLKAAEAYIKMNDYKKALKILDKIILKYGKTSRWGKQAISMKKGILK